MLRTWLCSLCEQNCYVAIRRGKKEIWEGTVVSLRRVKDDVDAVEAPLECGLQTDFKDWKEGDAIVAFKVSPRD